MGTPLFAVPILKSLYQNGYQVSVVYTQPPQKSQRGQKINKSPIQGMSETLKIEYRTPGSLKNNKDEYKYLKELNADIAIQTAFKELLTLEDPILMSLVMGYQQTNSKNQNTVLDQMKTPYS